MTPLAAVLAVVAMVATPLFLHNLAAPAMRAVPFVAAWLIAIEYAVGARRLMAVAAAAMLLGVAADVHDAAIVAGPVLLVIGVLTAARGRSQADALKMLSVSAAAFAAAILPQIIELAIHPEMIESRAMTHGLYDATRFNPLQGLREIVSWVSLTSRAGTYWSYLDPSFVFFSGSVLYPPALPLIAVAMWPERDQPRPAFVVASIGGLFAVPLAGALAGQPLVPARLILMLPCAAALQAYGVIHAWSIVRRWTIGPEGSANTRTLPGGTSSGRAAST